LSVQALLGSGDAPQPAIADPIPVAGRIASAEVTVNMTAAFGYGAVAEVAPMIAKRPAL
jgi:hypothetical protein